MTCRDSVTEGQALEATGTGTWSWIADRPEELLVHWPDGQRDLDLRGRIDDEGWHLLVSQLHEALVDDRPFQSTVRLRMDDGGERELSFRGAHLGGVGGATQVVGFCWQIGVVERAEMQAQWAPLAKLSHELRSPLAAIVSVLDDVGRSTDDEMLREALDRARESCTYMSRIIQDMLTGFRSGEAESLRHPEPLSTEALLRQILPMTAEAAARKGLAMDLWRDDTFPDAILVEPDALRRILQNLLDNAAKYTNKGSIELRLDVRGEDDEAWLCFEVVDTGPGMSEEEIEQLFEPFARGNDGQRRAPGLGIGLALSRQLATSLDGRLEVDSTPGEGSRFRLLIPARVTDEGALPAQTADIPIAVVPQGRRVLVVDDHPLLAKLTGRALAKLGCEVDVAENAHDALTMADGRVFDVVILDLDLPDQSGWDLCRQLSAREGLAHCRFVAYSGSELTHDRDAMRQAGFDAYFVKPASAEELLGA
jgi:signal transduction histidine kinase